MRFLALALIAGPVLHAAFTISSVMSAPFASGLVVSPSGARVAWIVNEEGKRNVWVAEAPTWKGRRLTSFDKDDGQDIAELAFTRDSETVVFARGGDFENGGENPNPDVNPKRPEQSIWSVSLGGEAHTLIEGRAPTPSPTSDTIAFLRGGQIFFTHAGHTEKDEKAALTVQTRGNIEQLSWSPDGRHLAFTVGRRDHAFIGLYAPETKQLEYVDASTGSESAPSWSPDSQRLAYIRVPAQGRVLGPRRSGEPWSIRVYDLQTRAAKEMFCADRGAGSVFHPLATEQQVFWDAGGHLVFPWEKSGYLHLYRSEDSGRAVELTPGEGEVEHAAQSSDRKTLFYSTNIGDIDRRHLWRVDADGKPQQVTRGEGIEWLPVATAKGLAALASSYIEKAHAVAVGAGGEVRSLGPEAAALSLVKPEAVTVTAADGMPLHGQLFRPANAESGKHPALIFFHGGSRRQMLLGFHYMYYYSNAYAMNQFLASQGYIVLSVNYRSGIGYGLNFREAIDYGPSGGSEYADVVGAGLYLKNRSDVDGRRIGVWGGSYGGYLTAMALARGSQLFAAGVDFHGVHDWSTTRNFDFSGGDPAEAERMRAAARVAFESSPMASVKDWRSPVLLIHGDDDRNVPFAQTVTLAAALRKEGVEFEELIFPNEIHDFLEHKHWVASYEAAAAFFKKHLRPGT